jgi:uridine kinase
MQQSSCCGIVPGKMTIKALSMKEGLEHVAKVVSEVKDFSCPYIIGVAGGSSSGKTTFAEKLMKILPAGTVRITLDDYYIGRRFSEENDLTFDEPESLDLELLKDNLKGLKKGEAIQKPKYSFVEDGGKRIGYEEIVPPKIIVVEGLFALLPEISSVVDFRIFVKADCHGRFVRRIMRDVNRTSWEATEILEYFLRVVEPMHCRHIDCQESFADLIVENPYDPVIEPEFGGCLKERQVKVRIEGSVSWEVLRRSGVEFLAESVQEDFYFAIPQQGRKDEILRVRKEGDSLFFTYKAPNVGNDARVKNKFEFPINELGRQRIEQFCQMVLRVSKRRKVFALGNIIFSQDHIAWRGKDYFFLEVRGLSGKKAQQAFFKKIGFENCPILHESYLELFSRQ